MTNEEKQALIEHCQRVLKGSNTVGVLGEVYQIALAALTAKLVIIKNSDFESALTLLNDVLDDCGDSERGLLLALSRMGIEVQE